MNKKLRGIASLFLATIIWGSAFISQTLGMDHISPFAFQAIRCFLAVVGLVIVISILDRFKKDGKTFLSRWADPQLWKAGILCGIPLFLACNMQQLGLAADTDPGKSGFLTAMYIIIVPILGIFQKKKPSVMVPISVLLAVCGLYCISCVGVTSISTGDLLTIACAFMFAVQIVFVDKYAASVDPLRLNAIQAAVCSVISAVIMCFTGMPTVKSIVDCALPLAHAGFLSMGAAYAFQIIGQKDVEPAAASLIMSLESVFALLFGILIMQEPLGFWKLLGCGLMFTAVILSQIPVKAKK
ncbi:MAG: DMT family transporter [Oscillospiraceae bacterium]|nr:DMT family transporter [Oscillospiraceae bacterium]